ncbi:hypothetical protein NPIL_100451 [Nephila pilipes]|uniref:Uncharacterized protein n=1 Tax=Nephila pilipes TaxID=299642 RepID=A0A8X6MCW2_NEPPI|nr:hypothetical protein NPIL_100451 [Nephila pilipes]
MDIEFSCCVIHLNRYKFFEELRQCQSVLESLLEIDPSSNLCKTWSGNHLSRLGCIYLELARKKRLSLEILCNIQEETRHTVSLPPQYRYFSFLDVMSMTPSNPKYLSQTAFSSGETHSLSMVCSRQMQSVTSFALSNDESPVPDFPDEVSASQGYNTYLAADQCTPLVSLINIIDFDTIFELLFRKLAEIDSDGKPTFLDI